MSGGVPYAQALAPALRRIANMEYRVPVRFGGAHARTHQLLLRFGGVAWDGSMEGHLVGEVLGRPWVVDRAVVYDPVAGGFVFGNQAGLQALGERLDLTAAMAGLVARSVAGLVMQVVEVLKALLTPGFILVGGLLGILVFYYLYYVLLALLAEKALWFVILPGLGLAAGSWLLHQWRIERLRVGLMAAACAAVDGAA